MTSEVRHPSSWDVQDQFWVASVLWREAELAREVLDAERWLRRALRSGAIEADTAYLTRWNDDLEQVEVLVGEP